LSAVRAAIGRIGIRKMLPDVAAPQRAENGVDDRMDDDVAVAMGHRADPFRDDHATEHERAAGLEPVNVIAVSDAEAKQFTHRRPPVLM
jgi:hypothetical protein